MWSNWSGLESADPSTRRVPGSAEEVAAAIVRARSSGTGVKMVGAGHSFTGIAAPRDVMLLPDRLQGVIEMDTAAMTVTARAGTRLHDLNVELAAAGLSLHNMGDIDEQTLAGAISTGTHGTGGAVSGLSAQVVALTMVTGTGDVVSVSPDSDRDVFDFARLGLGALGVLTDVTFRVEPLFGLEAVERPMYWRDFTDAYDDMTATADHVDAYWFPHTDLVLAKTNTRVGLDGLHPLGRVRRWIEDDFTQNTAFGALCRVTNRVPALIPGVNRLGSRALAARTYSDAAHRVFTTPRRVVFREMEYAVPRAIGLDVLAECRRPRWPSDVRISFPVEIRCAPADDVPLSTASGRDAMYLAFHTYRDTDHTRYFALLEPILTAAAGRPHWGKVHTLGARELRAAYPRFDEFLAARDRLDPDRVFRNPYLRRVLGD
jgi:FAD-linked oxidoreductase